MLLEQLYQRISGYLGDSGSNVHLEKIPHASQDVQIGDITSVSNIDIKASGSIVEPATKAPLAVI